MDRKTFDIRKWSFDICTKYISFQSNNITEFIFLLALLDVQTLHVHLPNHGFRTIRFDEAYDVQQVTNLIVGSMSPGQNINPQSYALRLRHMLTREV